MTTHNTHVDMTALESFLAESLCADVTNIEVLSDGLNLLLAISTVKEENAYVLRRPNKLRHTSLFNDLRAEYRLLQRLELTEIPTQTPVVFCDDASILGDEFFLTTYLAGETIPLGSDLPERFQTARFRRDVANCVVDMLAEIHTLDTTQFKGVCEQKTPQEQVNHAIERLDVATDVTGRERSALRAVGEWLQQNAPSKSEMTLVHGDFRPGNVLFAGTDKPEITGVLDWETAMLGDPLTELGYLLLRWRDDVDPTPSLDGLETRYTNEDAIESLREINEKGLSPFTAKPGSPTRRELVARYEEQTGIAFENERFYRAHAAFMLATVWEDLHRYRLEAGAASDFEPLVDYMSMVATSIVNGEFAL